MMNYIRDRTAIHAALFGAIALLPQGGCRDGGVVDLSSLDAIEVAWRTPGVGDPAPLDGLSADASHLFVLGGGVTAYDLGTGTPVWTTLPDGLAFRPSAPVAAGGKVLVAANIAVALDAATGTEVWRFTPDTLALAYGAGDEQAFYIGTQSRRVYALDQVGGQVLWWVDLLPDVQYEAFVESITVAGDTVYAALTDDVSPTGHLSRGVVVALDRDTGEELWRFANERQGEDHDARNLAVFGPMLVFNDYRGNGVIGIDRFSGMEVWRYEGPAGAPGARHPLPSAEGVVFTSSGDT